MTVASYPRPALDGERRREWTADEFQRASAMGLFRPDERLELTFGEIIEKMPPNPPHASFTDIIAETLRRIAPADACVRVEKPLVLGTSGQPQPDIAVVRGALRDYADHHPTASDAHLIVEVSDTTLAYDQGRKSLEYALAGIAEYWIVNFNDRQVEVYRDPQNGQWQETLIRKENETVAPRFAPQTALAVAGMLP